MARFLWLFCWLPAACLVSPTSERHCDALTLCPDGFSCLHDICIADGDLPEGDICTASRQCDGFPEVSCSERTHTCRRVCTALLAADSTCEHDQYCRAERVSSLVAEWTGVCAGSQCRDEFACIAIDPLTTCVPVTEHAGVCLEPCAVDLSAGAYADTCTPVGGLTRSCQPVGLAGRQALVCLPRLVDEGMANDAGESCDLYDAPCKLGLACVGERDQEHCRAYCDPSRGDADCPQASTPYCCAVRSLATPLYHVCLSDPCEP